FGAGELAQLPLAHALDHFPRRALEALLRALPAFGGERRARRHLLLLRSRRHGILLWGNFRATSTVKCVRRPKVPTAAVAEPIVPAPRSAVRNLHAPAPYNRRAGAART